MSSTPSSASTSSSSGSSTGSRSTSGHVHVTFTLTTPACPIGPQVTEQIDEFVSELDDVEEVSSSMVFTPPWTPEKMSEDAKFALGY